jgi:hypothetical protein
VFRIRIRIRVDFDRLDPDPDRDPGGKKLPTKIEKPKGNVTKFHVLKCFLCSLLRAEGFSSSFDVPNPDPH